MILSTHGIENFGLSVEADFFSPQECGLWLLKSQNKKVLQSIELHWSSSQTALQSFFFL